MLRSLTYLPCAEATEAEVAGMEAIAEKGEKGDGTEKEARRRNNELKSKIATVQKHLYKVCYKTVCWI
jgi:hypothetical protein